MTRAPLPGLGAGPPSPAPAPFNIEALLASAVQAHDAGRTAEAERGYRLLLTMAPRDPRVPARLAVLLLEQGRNADALPLIDQSLALDARQPGMLANKGAALVALGRFPEAVAACEQAIALQPEPERAGGYVNLGVYLQSLDRHDEAAEAYRKAAVLDPDLPEAWGNLGIARLNAGRSAEALEALDRAVRLRPDYADAWINRGTALQALGRPEEALESCDRALPLPGAAAASAWSNRGLALQALGRIDEARASFDRALALQPDFADALWNKALLLLALGDYEAGWRLFEWRWKRSGAPAPPDFAAAPWLGAPPLKRGQTLLLHAEQGYGDTLQMLRYVPLLAERGLRVKLICPEPLLELAATVDGLAEPPRAGGEATFDAHIPLMSLPLALGTRLETAPREVPYLGAPLRAKAAWAERLGPTGRLRVGLAWSGNPDHRNDRNRSLPFAALARLLEADAEFHSLHKDYRPGEAEAVRAGGRVIDHSAEIESFSDTAALIDAMDVVVSVDTAVAHLAGALAKRLLLLLPFAPDFRWGLAGGHTPWYPTARLLRQEQPGEWGPALDAAAALLEA